MKKSRQNHVKKDKKKEFHGCKKRGSNSSASKASAKRRRIVEVIFRDELPKVKQVVENGQGVPGFGRKKGDLFKHAITAGKRVRTDTNISNGSLSVSSAVVELIETSKVLILELADTPTVPQPSLQDINVGHFNISNQSDKSTIELQTDHIVEAVKNIPIIFQLSPQYIGADRSSISNQGDTSTIKLQQLDMITMSFGLSPVSNYDSLGVLILIMVVLGVVVSLSFGLSPTSD
ncbi:hypothetical protein FXO38_28853 [Capsicum annuum]|nr:hypothetical protein FXO38_28853 [Capsicum annuum]